MAFLFAFETSDRFSNPWKFTSPDHRLTQLVSTFLWFLLGPPYLFVMYRWGHCCWAVWRGPHIHTGDWINCETIYCVPCIKPVAWMHPHIRQAYIFSIICHVPDCRYSVFTRNPCQFPFPTSATLVLNIDNMLFHKWTTYLILMASIPQHILLGSFSLNGIENLCGSRC